MQKAVEIKHDGLTLRGMVHIPEKNKVRYPFIIMFHGFSAQRCEAQFMFVKLSRELEKEGIGSARFDFIGSGESDGCFKDMTVSSELNDAKTIFNFVRSLDYVDEENLFILGMSMGGLVASLFAPETNKLKGLVLWAPAGSMMQLIVRIIHENRKYIMPDGTIDICGNILSKDFIDDLGRFDIYRKAAEYKGHVLIIHGTEDQDIPLHTANCYKNAYEHSEVILVKDADHAFSRYLWKKELIISTVSFIKNSCN